MGRGMVEAARNAKLAEHRGRGDSAPVAFWLSEG